METHQLSVSASESGAAFKPRIGRSVSIDHAAKLLHVSRRTIYNRIREGRLKTVRTLGGSQRVLIDSIQVFVLTSDPRAASLPEVFGVAS